MFTLLNQYCIKAQSVIGWAFVIWAISLCGLGLIALIDDNYYAFILSSIFLPIVPVEIGVKKRLALVLLSLSCYWFGSASFLISIPLAFALLGLSRESIYALVTFLTFTLLSPYLQSLNIYGFGQVPISSLVFILIPSWGCLVIFFNQIDKKTRLQLLFIPILIASIANVLFFYWLSPTSIANEIFRLSLAFAPLLIIREKLTTFHLKATNFKSSLIIAFALGGLSTILIPSNKINGVVFDESHGKWETVLSSFNQNDFGRSANYTYSQLFKLAKSKYKNTKIYDQEQNELPDQDQLFVLKMPAQRLSKPFLEKLTSWVHSGGRLLVVADHTDLYDTTQNLNELLSTKFGTVINSDAVYDFEGMPNTPDSSFSEALRGKIISNGHKFFWQTGTSLKTLPFNTVELANYGLSFTESGDYSRANRFGTFSPSPEKRFLKHSSVIAFSSGKGAVALVLDSTPWSNFSVFKEQYPKLFFSIVRALEAPDRLKIIGLSGWLLFSILLILLICENKKIYITAAFVTGLVLSSLTLQGLGSHTSQRYGEDYKLRVALGEDARLEFLKQILLPSEQNFARIISAMGKYDLLPSASDPSEEVPNLEQSKRWLLINPDAKQLPKIMELSRFIESGGSITILFSPHQARSTEVLNWLKTLSLFTKTSIGLKVSDSKITANGSYLNGRSPALGREVVTMVYALQTSLFASAETDQLFQSFNLRPTKDSKAAGSLNISFQSDQFSDEAIGDVWEGVDPSSIGKMREQQLASVILEKDHPTPYPASLIKPIKLANIELTQYLVLEDGVKKILGKLPASPSEDLVVRKFQRLRDQSESFVKFNCPYSKNITQCENRLLDDSYVEWLVSWRADSQGKVESIELVHDRRISGLNSSLNVIYGK